MKYMTRCSGVPKVECLPPCEWTVGKGCSKSKAPAKSPKKNASVSPKSSAKSVSPKSSAKSVSAKSVSAKSSSTKEMKMELIDNGPNECQVVEIANSSTKNTSANEIKVPQSLISKLKVGAIFKDDENQDRNRSIFGIWNGKKIVKLDIDTFSDYGAIPALKEFDIASMNVPPTYWENHLGYNQEYVWINCNALYVSEKENMLEFKLAGKTYYLDAAAQVLGLDYDDSWMRVGKLQMINTDHIS